jgi:hypothetical protein
MPSISTVSAPPDEEEAEPEEEEALLRPVSSSRVAVRSIIIAGVVTTAPPSPALAPGPTTAGVRTPGQCRSRGIVKPPSHSVAKPCDHAHDNSQFNNDNAMHAMQFIAEPASP